MQKRILAVSYWLGVTCTVLAIISRVMMAFAIMPPRIGFPEGVIISYLSFFHGASLFFLLAIATWCYSSKS
jgi:hypothetical protein